MKINIYSVFNKLTCELNFDRFEAPNHDVAKQYIINSFYNKQGELNHALIRNAEHYKVCYLGEYDTQTGLYGLAKDFETLWEMADIAKLIQEKENSPKTE